MKGRLLYPNINISKPTKIKPKTWLSRQQTNKQIHTHREKQKQDFPKQKISQLFFLIQFFLLQRWVLLTPKHQCYSLLHWTEAVRQREGTKWYPEQGIYQVWSSHKPRGKNETLHFRLVARCLNVKLQNSKTYHLLVCWKLFKSFDNTDQTSWLRWSLFKNSQSLLIEQTCS